MSTRARDAPMWTPLRTPETYAEPRESDAAAPRASWWRFVGLALVVSASGYLLSEVGITAAERTKLSETTVGAYFTAIATSIPELVLAIAAVRRGALNLAVGDILGGNCFDVLFLSFGDAAFRRGSLYHAIGREDLFFMSLTILLTAILLLGMLRREKHGIGNIGFESFLILVLYGALSFVVVGGGE
jgi:cation:H+ antiporter